MESNNMITNAMEDNASRVFSALQNHGFSFHKVSEQCYELRNLSCVIQLTFDRYDPTMCVVLLSDPRTAVKPNEGMSLWVLRHMRGVRNLGNVPDSFTAIGQMLINSFSDLLNGDFSSVSEYSTIESRIFDLAHRVEKLPAGHPTRQKYNDYDIRWLDEIEG